MGQKINPNGFRVGVIRDWTAKWYAEKDYAAYLSEDLRSVSTLKSDLLTPLFQLSKLNGLLTA